MCFVQKYNNRINSVRKTNYKNFTTKMKINLSVQYQPIAIKERNSLFIPVFPLQQTNENTFKGKIPMGYVSKLNR